jgi:hypothetical protein
MIYAINLSNMLSERQVLQQAESISICICNVLSYSSTLLFKLEYKLSDDISFHGCAGTVPILALYPCAQSNNILS